MPERYYFVYILSNDRNGTLYVGVTSDLVKRIWQHRNGEFEGFTKEYGINKLVYYDTFGDINEAIKFEKQLKRWRRNWKIKLIEKDNSEWIDLYDKMIEFVV